MEELRTEFDKLMDEYRGKGYSDDTLYAWFKARIADAVSSQLEPLVGLQTVEAIGNVLTELNVNGMLQPDAIDKILKIFGYKPYYFEG